MLFRTAAAGLLPFPLAVVVDWRTALVVPSLVLAILLVCAAARDWQGSGIAMLVAAFGAHSLVMLTLAGLAPAVVQDRFPDGVAYWQQTRHWIFTGENPEYETARWLSEHALLFVQVLVASYISFGFLPVFVGFFQINLMNVYIGNLLTHARSPALALGLGWHPWSVLRGIGFLLVTFEVVSYSLQRLASTPLSTSRRRVWRWSFGIGFWEATENGFIAIDNPPPPSRRIRRQNVVCLSIVSITTCSKSTAHLERGDSRGGSVDINASLPGCSLDCCPSREWCRA